MWRSVFWLSVLGLFYCYLGYPAALAVMGYIRGGADDPRSVDPTRWPGVSVILTVFNEEKIIAAKIENFLACEYRGPSELIIVSDGSTDATVAIIRNYESERVRLIENSERRGKDRVLDDAVRESRGEILVFTDTGAMFARNALEELVRPFADPDISLVSGVASYAGAPSANLYRRYEDWLKSLESRLGVLSGALGPMYALRRSSYRPKELSLINDFTDSILAALERKTATIATRAMCYQDRLEDHHWARQERMVARAAAALFHYLPKLVTARRWKLIFVLVSHKLLRWFTVPLMVLLAASAWFEREAGGIYLCTLHLCAMYIAAAAIGFFAEVARRPSSMNIAYHFLAMNLAALVGLVRYARGKTPTVWEPRGL